MCHILLFLQNIWFSCVRANVLILSSDTLGWVLVLWAAMCRNHNFLKIHCGFLKNRCDPVCFGCDLQEIACDAAPNVCNSFSLNEQKEEG